MTILLVFLISLIVAIFAIAIAIAAGTTMILSFLSSIAGPLAIVFLATASILLIANVVVDTVKKYKDWKKNTK